MHTVEQLLLRGESESLDFKKDQYRFIGAQDHEKTELLKDILAMANAWRTTTAYILIGVREEKGKNPVVEGIAEADHFDDASLQQFINGKTQRPIRLNYYKAQIQGKSIGVIEIPVQDRPFHLRQNFHSVEANAVYVRRGSSTDKASIDEISKMGRPLSASGEHLVLEFVDPDTQRKIGHQLTIESQVLDLKEGQNIPDFKGSRPSGPFPLYIETKRPNADYYRELVSFAEARLLFRRAILTISNTGGMKISNIRVEIEIKDPDREWEFCDGSELLSDPPRQYYDLVGTRLPPIVSARGCFCEIEYVDGTWHLAFNFRDLQPARSLKSGVSFGIGTRKTQRATFAGKIFGDELAMAGSCEIAVEATALVLKTDLATIKKELGAHSRKDEDD